MNQKTIRPAGETNGCVPVPAKRLLLVEDDESMSRLLALALQEWSFVTCTAANVREAQNAVVTEEPFSVIVSDFHLPDGNGLEFLDWLKCKIRIQVPFLLMSGGVVRAPLAEDGYEFLTKPFHLEEFHRRVEELSCLKLPAPGSFHLSAAQEAMASVYARSKDQPDG